jgi:acyl carrier protein
MEETTNRIRAFIVENFLFGDDDGFASNASLMEAGIIDSTGILELVGFLEDEFGITVADDELIPENLDSVDAIGSYLGRKQTAGG